MLSGQLIENNQSDGEEKRTDEWLKKTQANLHVIFEKMLTVTEFHWKVNLQLVTTIRQLVENCSSTLEPSLPLLIKKLVQLTTSDNGEVADAAQLSIQSLSRTKVDLNSAIRQNLYDIATSLPRVVAQGSKSCHSCNIIRSNLKFLLIYAKVYREQHTVLQELHGHLMLMGPGLGQSLKFSVLRQRLFKGLLISSTLNGFTIIEDGDQFTFRYLHDDRSIALLNSCCISLSDDNSFSDSIDFLMDVFRQKAQYHKEAVYLAIQMIKSLPETTEKTVILSAITQEYASELCTLENNKENKLISQLILQALAAIASRMNGEFSPLLLQTMRPILEHTGDPHCSSVALNTLQAIAKALDFSSVSQLVENNFDYFAPQLCFRLRSISRYPRAVDLLRALLLLSDLQMDDWLERIVHEAMRGLDLHRRQALLYVQVLQLYCQSARKAMPPEPISMPSDEDSIDLVEKCRRYHIESCPSQSFTDDISDESDPNGETLPAPEEAEKPDELPPKVNLIASILQRCAHLLPQSDDQTLLSTLLETIRHSVAVLSRYENVLLPKVHQLWEPLKREIFSGSPLRQRQSFAILSILIGKCPDFLRQRVLTEVFPNLLTFLERQSTSSKARKNCHAYSLSQSYQLQKILLEEMAGCVVALQVPVIQLAQILEVVSLYLDCQQAHELQVSVKEY